MKLLSMGGAAVLVARALQIFVDEIEDLCQSVDKLREVFGWLLMSFGQKESKSKLSMRKKKSNIFEVK